MISFTCDYSEGAHPGILERLLQTNFVQVPGYGNDPFCASAKEKIRHCIGRPEADVFFLVGGTQTNSTVIDAMLRGYEGVIAAHSGHIAVHEAGAVEFSGHKVLCIPSSDGTLDPSAVRDFLEAFHSDPSADHMVQPGMVYISFPTEWGTLYTKAALMELHDICQKWSIPLFVDGARLGYGLCSKHSDITIDELASFCDVFYIGGTKCGALCGEAVVFPRGNAPSHFFTTVKQHGALLAKGRLLGLQFDTLFTDNLYFEICSSAMDMAERLGELFAANGIPMYIPSPTNQLFPVLTPGQYSFLKSQVIFEDWMSLPDGNKVVRFATSWATDKSQIEELSAILESMPK